MTAHRIDFIDEDDARGVFLALFEQVAHAGRTNADKHFHEIGTADGEKWNVGFAGNRSCQQRFSGARRSNQKHTLGNAPAQFLEFLRLLQKVDDFLELFLRFFNTCNILESNYLLMCRQQAGAAFSEGKGFVSTALHLTHEENPEADNEEERSP